MRIYASRVLFSSSPLLICIMGVCVGSCVSLTGVTGFTEITGLRESLFTESLMRPLTSKWWRRWMGQISMPLAVFTWMERTWPSRPGYSFWITPKGHCNLDVQKAYDKAWLDAIMYALHKNGVEGKNLRMIKKLNSNLTARIQTRYGLTRRINIKDSIRQGGVLSVIEYATLIDEISKELKEKNLGYVTEANITLDSLLWMDDVWHNTPRPK